MLYRLTLALVVFLVLAWTIRAGQLAGWFAWPDVWVFVLLTTVAAFLIVGAIRYEADL